MPGQRDHFHERQPSGFSFMSYLSGKESLQRGGPALRDDCLIVSALRDGFLTYVMVSLQNHVFSFEYSCFLAAFL